MRIDGEIKVNGFLRTCDLEAGEVFAFEDDCKNLFMITDSDIDTIVNLTTGETLDESDHEDRPVKRINAKIVIEG